VEQSIAIAAFCGERSLCPLDDRRGEAHQVPVLLGKSVRHQVKVLFFSGVASAISGEKSMKVFFTGIGSMAGMLSEKTPAVI
jgi:hypothetical protein